MIEFKNLTTDELLDALPDNLMPMKNSNAPDFDRWRIYNYVTKKVVEGGHETAHKLLVNCLSEIEELRNKWVNGG